MNLYYTTKNFEYLKSISKYVNKFKDNKNLLLKILGFITI